MWNTLESRVDALERLWRILFQNENLSTEIKRLEEKTRFDSLIWLATRFYYTGNLEMMKKTLLESLNHTKLSVRGALIYWLCKFFRIAREEVKYFDASDLMSSKEWQELEELEFGKPEKSSVLKVQNKEIAGRKQLASAAAGSNLEITTKINFQTESSSDYVPKINLKPTWTRFVGKHRSGWKFALQSLLPLHTDGGIYFDGGCDRTFDTKNQMVQTDLTKGWIGLFHNPPNMPEWFAPTQTQKAILESKIFRNALEHCYGIFCLSRTHQDWLAKQIDVPIVALLHPTETPEVKFSLEKFSANPEKRVVQIGHWIRKLHSIHFLPTMLKRCAVHQNFDYVQKFFETEKEKYDKFRHHLQRFFVSERCLRNCRSNYGFKRTRL